MFDVNMNMIELDVINRFLENDTPETRKEIIDTINMMLEIRFNRGRRLGKAEFTDAIVESIVCELRR